MKKSKNKKIKKQNKPNSFMIHSKIDWNRLFDKKIEDLPEHLKQAEKRYLIKIVMTKLHLKECSFRKRMKEGIPPKYCEWEFLKSFFNLEDVVDLPLLNLEELEENGSNKKSPIIRSFY